jgi:DNA-binding transcriptional regulator/RsmH inhibitor MraZ
MLTGAGDHIELWNMQDWEQYSADNMAQFQKRMAEIRLELLQKQSQETEG